MKSRYFLDRDESSHWYIIPEIYREEWDRWSSLNSDDDDEANEVPSYAQPLGGHPNRVTFTDPTV